MNAIFLCKPATTSVPTMTTLSPMFDVHSSTGVALLPPVSFHSNIDTKMRQERFGDIRKFDSVNDIATMPGPISHVLYNYTATPGQLLVRIPITPAFATLIAGGTDGTWTPTPSQFVSAFFDRWRGSMQYLLVGSSPQTTPSKICISYYPCTAALPGTPAQRLATMGEVNTIILVVQGTVVKEFAIPYLNNVSTIELVDPSQTIADSANAGFLDIWVLTPPAGEDIGMTTTYLTIEAAAGRDSTWYQPAVPVNGIVPSIADGQVFAYSQSLVRRFEKDFACLDETWSTSPGAEISGDIALGLKEMYTLPRWTEATGGIWIAPGQPRTQPGAVSFSKEMFTCFRAWRGGRYLWTIGATTQAGDSTMQPVMISVPQSDYYSFTREPIAPTSAEANSRSLVNDRGVHIPWHCPNSYWSENAFTRHRFWANTDYVLGVSVGIRSGVYIVEGWADDFQFGHMSPPMQFVFPPPPAGDAPKARAQKRLIGRNPRPVMKKKEQLQAVRSSKGV